MSAHTPGKEPLFYVEGGMIWKRHLTTNLPDGTTVLSLGFPVCTPHDAVRAKDVAAVLCAGEAATQLAEALRAIIADARSGQCEEDVIAIGEAALYEAGLETQEDRT